MTESKLSYEDFLATTRHHLFSSNLELTCRQGLSEDGTEDDDGASQQHAHPGA